MSNDGYTAHTKDDDYRYGVKLLTQEKEDLQDAITNMLNDFNRRWGGKVMVERIHVDILNNAIGAEVPFEHVVNIDLRL